MVIIDGKLDFLCLHILFHLAIWDGFMLQKDKKYYKKIQVENMNETSLNTKDDVKSNKSHGFGLR